ncbi:MAG: hypothetical protein GY869_29720 [Planctomycetes bacterium]|nr:hypothetical protein [Planctomycetota bacterium]
MKKGYVVGLLILLVLSISSVNAQDKLYWIDQDSIKRSNLSGSELETLVTGLTDARDIALDMFGGKMYWSNGSAKTIQRANLDGGGVESIVTSSFDIDGIDLDLYQQKIYWAEYDDTSGYSKIKCANMDGSGLEEKTNYFLQIFDLAIDAAAGDIYYSVYIPQLGTGCICKDDLDDVTGNLLISDLDTSIYIALNVAHNKIYWTSADPVSGGGIYRADLEGSNIENLQTFSGTLVDKQGIALDSAGGKMYWTYEVDDSINRANLDGSGATVIMSGLTGPIGLALTKTPDSISFNYQGRLSDADNPANGLYDFEFNIFDDVAGGDLLSRAFAVDNVEVVNGTFTQELVFFNIDSPIFDGDDRFLQIAVRPGSSNNPDDFVVLGPRQKITATPWSLYSQLAWSVDWHNIFNMPSDIANGDHDTQLSESQVDNYVTNNGYVTSWTEIPDIPGGFADGVDDVLDTDWVISGSDMYSEVSGNVGIGTTIPGAKFTVDGAILRHGSTMIGTFADTHINLGISSFTGAYAAEVGQYSTVSGGYNNSAGGGSVIGGGINNQSWGANSTVAGGLDNKANDTFATVGGGTGNDASGFSAVIPGGSSNTATGSYSFAAGYQANALHDGSFVWADSTGPEFDSTGPDQFLIRAAGGVGIGKANPDSPMHIYGPSPTGSFGAILSLEGSEQTGAANTGGGITFIGHDGTKRRTWGTIRNLKENAGIDNEASYMTFTTRADGATVPSERVRIDSVGNVGLGTSSPLVNLHIEKDDIGLPATALSSNDVLVVEDSDATIGLYSDGQGSRGSGISFGEIGSGALVDKWLLQRDTKINGSEIRFTYTDSTSTSFDILEMEHNGNIGVGTNGPTERLDVNGAVRVRGIAAGTGTTVVADGNGKLWINSSSKRYKQNITDLQFDPQAVLQLRPVHFQYQNTGQKDVGLIAEEVEEQVKDLVIYDNQGRPDGVKYDKLSVYLLEVVKELKAENDLLKQRLDALEKK